MFFTHVVCILHRENDGENQIALIHFEKEPAAKTATLLSNGKTIRPYLRITLIIFFYLQP